MKVFGRSQGIGCGECIPLTETPVGEPCLRCGIAIEAGDVGFIMPHESGTPEEPVMIEHPWHVACLRAALLAEATS